MRYFVADKIYVVGEGMDALTFFIQLRLDHAQLITNNATFIYSRKAGVISVKRG